LSSIARSQSHGVAEATEVVIGRRLDRIELLRNELGAGATIGW
jgi:hypothetical protein